MWDVLYLTCGMRCVCCSDHGVRRKALWGEIGLLGVRPVAMVAPHNHVNVLPVLPLEIQEGAEREHKCCLEIVRKS